MKIQDQVFVVTGGSSGLGEATVKKLVSLGAYVAVFDFDESKAAELEALDKNRVLFSRCDVTSEKDFISGLDKIQQTWKDKKLGGVVHCAGVAMVGKTIENDGKLDPNGLQTFNKVHQINISGSFNVARQVASRIALSNPLPKSKFNPDSPEITTDRGVIILVSSVSYQEGQMGQVAYGSSKAGVAGLTLPMARDLAKFGIRVVTIAPSIFATNMGANLPAKARESLLQTALFPVRFGHPDEFAHLAASIIENGMLNGAVLRIDGGSRMAKF